MLAYGCKLIAAVAVPVQLLRSSSSWAGGNAGVDPCMLRAGVCCGGPVGLLVRPLALGKLSRAEGGSGHLVPLAKSHATCYMVPNAQPGSVALFVLPSEPRCACNACGEVVRQPLLAGKHAGDVLAIDLD
jgi:hypothetical protein